MVRIQYCFVKWVIRHPSTMTPKNNMLSQKTWPPGGGVSFPYVYRGKSSNSLKSISKTNGQILMRLHQKHPWVKRNKWYRKDSWFWQISGCHGNQKENLKYPFSLKLAIRFQYCLVEIVIRWPSTKVHKISGSPVQKLPHPVTLDAAETRWAIWGHIGLLFITSYC